VTDTSNSVDPAAYVAMAAKMSASEGIAYRYGDSTSAAIQKGDAPTIYQRPDTIRRNASDGGYWQVGGPEKSDLGDYFQNFYNTLYVADAPDARVGVASLLTAATTFNTFMQRPQPIPLLTGSVFTDAQVQADYAGLTFNGLDDRHGEKFGAHRPVAAARCTGSPGWCVEAVVAYQNGLISTAWGSTTASNSSSVQLPANKVPTAITQTNSGEFALVSVWDTAAQKGQIAVVALASYCQDCDISRPDTFFNYNGEWGAVHPGLPNRGNTGFMKLLGFVDLPDTMRAPTEIAATTGWDPATGRPVDANGNYVDHWATPLSNETIRQSYVSGKNVGAYANGGVAVVVSKSEQRAAFIDLKPLFSYYRSMYFGAKADYDKTTRLGQADDQWPYAFSQMPSNARPQVLKVMDLGARPTAVKATMWGDNLRAFIATQEGNLRLFDLAGYGNGNGSSPAGIAQVGSIAVGANPTSIAYVRGEPGHTGNQINEKLMVLSRAEGAVRWINLSADRNSGTVQPNVLRDSRIVDPIAIEDNENHGTTFLMLTMADYGGKAVRNYRWGPVIFNSNPGGACALPNGCGMGQDGNAAFEYGGATVLPGKPFMVTGANVP